MAENKQGFFETFSEFNRIFFNADIARKVGVMYVEAGEKLWNMALDHQAKMTEWAKDSPLAPFFELQNSLSRDFATMSVKTIRQLWQIEDQIS